MKNVLDPEDDPLREHLREQYQALRSHRYWEDFVKNAGEALTGDHPRVHPDRPLADLIADFQQQWSGVTGNNPDTLEAHNRMLAHLNRVFEPVPVPTARVTAFFAWRFGLGALFPVSVFRRNCAQLIHKVMFEAAATQP